MKEDLIQDTNGNLTKLTTLTGNDEIGIYIEDTKRVYVNIETIDELIKSSNNKIEGISNSINRLIEAKKDLTNEIARIEVETKGLKDVLAAHEVQKEKYQEAKEKLNALGNKEG